MDKIDRMNAIYANMDMEECKVRLKVVMEEWEAADKQVLKRILSGNCSRFRIAVTKREICEDHFEAIWRRQAAIRQEATRLQPG